MDAQTRRERVQKPIKKEVTPQMRNEVKSIYRTLAQGFGAVSVKDFLIKYNKQVESGVIKPVSQLKSFLLKYQGKASLEKLIQSYIKLVEQAPRIKESTKQDQYYKINELLNAQLLPEGEIKAEKKVTNDKYHINKRLQKLDKKGESVEKFISYMFRGLDSVDDNPSAKQVKYLISHKRSTFDGLADMDDQYYAYLVQKKDTQKIKEYQELMHSYLQTTEVKLYPKDYFTQNKGKFSIILSGTLNDFYALMDKGRYSRSNKIYTAVVNNILSITNPDTDLYTIYEKYANALEKKKGYKEMEALNHIMDEFIVKQAESSVTQTQVESLPDTENEVESSFFDQVNDEREMDTQAELDLLRTEMRTEDESLAGSMLVRNRKMERVLPAEQSEGDSLHNIYSDYPEFISPTEAQKDNEIVDTGYQADKRDERVEEIDKELALVEQAKNQLLIDFVDGKITNDQQAKEYVLLRDKQSKLDKEKQSIINKNK